MRLLKSLPVLQIAKTCTISVYILDQRIEQTVATDRLVLCEGEWDMFPVCDILSRKTGRPDYRHSCAIIRAPVV